MELKTYFAQDKDGAVIPGAFIYLYEKGTTNPVSGILDAAGNSLTNPFNADAEGKAQLAAPNGLYDLRMTGAGRDNTIRIQFLDATQAIEQINTSVVQAEAAASYAQSASDAALLSAGIYADTTIGISSTVPGDYFSVPSAAASEFLNLYVNNAGIADFIKTYPSAVAVSEVASVLNREESAGVAWAVSDPAGRPAISVHDDGSVEVGAFTAETLNGTPVSEIITGSDTYYQGNYPAEVIYFNNTGQSLAEGSNGDLTITQEYDSIGFPARADTPTSIFPLTVANTEIPTRGESPMYGALGHIKELIEEENGISYTEQSFQLLACNNGYGGQAISTFKKGRPEYDRSITQVQAGYGISQSAGKTFMGGAVFWTQGESDTATTYAAYKADLIQIANDHNADIKAITGQIIDIPVITYQTGRIANKAISLAQLDATDDSPLIYMACPMYQFDYYDTLHVTAESSKWLGAYYGLVYKRVVIDGEDWKPVRPISHVAQGNVLNVKFHVPVKPLVIDTTTVPAQTNHGFALVDSLDNSLAINAVSVIGPDTIKVVAAAPIPAGAKLRYAFDDALAKGNIRDSQGETMIYSAINKPMHNWCVIFEYPL